MQADFGSEARDTASALGRGGLCRCPNCGQGALFTGFLTVRDRCEACGEELHHHRADDAPPYFTISIVGHVVLTAALGVETFYGPPLWLHAVLWGPLTLGMSLGLLRPIKGAIVGLQWAWRMHGFGGAEATADA
ncbi:DUF983 domain-containing protein [Faunimonas sp. B44]|uniref:DUF983 domain-containing protein n=1 Tax=Faunimonas sp. B44 TaxID=3461493 RepID=UPI004044A1BC